jgi:hypothetical protein
MNRNGIMALLLVGVLANVVVATSGFSQLSSGLYTFCTQLRTIMGVVVMLMIIGAAVVYAGGQIMGAETRARANVWATAMLTGSLIGLLIYAIAPVVLQGIGGVSVAC